MKTIFKRLFSKPDKESQYYELLNIANGVNLENAKHLLGESNFHWDYTGCWNCEGYVKYKDIKAYFTVDTNVDKNYGGQFNIIDFE